MNFEHTPGPWEVVGNYVRTKRMNENHPSGHDGIEVASCQRFLPEYPSNARLIAASPRMLGALERLVPYLQKTEDGEGQAFYCMVTEAIAEAKGEAS